jgi:hypothetical protein
MWVSTGKAGIPSENTSTIAAVFGPTPFRLTNQSRAWSVGKSRSHSRLISPRSALMALSAA